MHYTGDADNKHFSDTSKRHIRSTRIVTSFVLDKDRDLLLIVKRSNKVKSMKSMWAGISGVIEGGEPPLERAKIEIFEEVGILPEQIQLIRSADEITIESPQYVNHEWRIFSFLFAVKDPVIKLNWENSEYRWIKQDELVGYQTVPNLSDVLKLLLV